MQNKGENDTARCTRKILGMSVHPFSHILEFRGGKIKNLSPALRASDWKCPMCVWEVEE